MQQILIFKGGEYGRIKERIDLINIEDEMQRAYIDYSMSVIVGRALQMLGMD